MNRRSSDTLASGNRGGHRRFRTLEAKGKKVVRISGQYNRTPTLPKDALTTGQYDPITKVDFDQAMKFALLASVSSELSVNEYNAAKAERLEALAKSFHVDTTAIRKQVAAEVAATKGKASWKPGPKETPQQ